MRILLDTHFVIELIDDVQNGISEPGLLELAQREGELVASVISLWEAAIKARLGKLPLLHGVDLWPSLLDKVEVVLIPFTKDHVLTKIGHEPASKDPFDRALLSTAAAEGCKLLTRDRLLESHPLAWRPFLR